MKNYLQKKLISVSFYPLIFLAIVWLVFLIENLSQTSFADYGVLPRKLSGIKGILFSVFIHGNLDHIASNSLPILFLGMLLFFFYRSIAFPVFLWIWLISGVWLWIGGRNDQYHPVYHIGASTLIYGLATFLFFSGVFRKHLRLMVVSALVVFLYGSIMWGIFPLKQEISWEGHLFGAIAGLIVAYSYRKEGPQQRKFEWEHEEEEEEGEQFWKVDQNEQQQTSESQQNAPIQIVYRFKESEKPTSPDK